MTTLTSIVVLNEKQISLSQGAELFPLSGASSRCRPTRSGDGCKRESRLKMGESFGSTP